jgi:hypothetical protein
MSPNAVPDLDTLFGPTTFCDCEDCRSVLSPAAYLVDAIQTILVGQIGVAGLAGKTGKDCLDARRPDICRLELSCDNTNKPVPYIDLVNEILENAVAAGPPPVATVGEPAELAANPQQVNEAAYGGDKPGPLASAVFPWTLPFDLWTAESRLYLEQLGVPRDQFLATFRQRKAEPLAQRRLIALTDDLLVAEYLELTPLERDLILGSAPVAPLGPWSAWGFPDDTQLTPDNPPNAWVASLSLENIKALLHRTGLSYDELTELLTTRFINPGGPADPKRVDFVSQPGSNVPLDSCDITQLVLANLTVDILGRMHRFTRLRRKLGWTATELDQALAAFDARDIKALTLVQLAQVVRLRSTLNVALPTLLAWWSPIETRGDREGKNSFYERLFQSRSLTSADPKADPFDLVQPTRDEIVAKATPILPALVPAVLGSTGLSAADFVRLVQAKEVEDAFTLTALSRIYRVASFTRALGLTVQEYLIARALFVDKAIPVSLEPFDPAHPEQAVLFAEQIDAIRRAGFTLKELDYVIAGSSIRGIALAGRTLVALLVDLREGLRKIASDYQTADDPRESLSRAFLQQRLATALGLDAASARMLLAGAGCIVSALDAKRSVLDDFLPADDADLTAWSATLDSVASEIGKAEERLDEALAEVAGGSRLAAQIQDLRVLHRVSMLIGKFALTPEELPWVLKSGIAPNWAGWLDPNLLPPRGVAPLFNAWTRLARWAELRQSLPSGLLLTILERASVLNPVVADILSPLAERTRWSATDLAYLAGPDVLNLTLAPALNEWLDEGGVGALVEGMIALQRLGVSAPEHIASWRLTPAKPVTSRQTKSAVKAGAEGQRWLDLTKPLQDDLRERRRAALVAYLIGNGLAGPSVVRFKDANELFDHFLIDVEMSPCQLTSRVKQAIGSVQLFAQRCLMGLENYPFGVDGAKNVLVGTEGVNWWKWMRNYRVWEANRKVFLFPENWVHPELRDDKTPFFRDLENQLMQGDVTAESAEDAYRDYLEKLQQVARLEIVGACVGSVAGEEQDVLHVFGRTWSAPHHYFYRRRAVDGECSAWEKVTVDIQGNQLLPIVWNRRLHIIWPILTKQVEEADGSGGKARYWWEIQLGLSEYKHHKWLPKQLSAGPPLVAGRTLVDEVSHLRLRARVDPAANQGDFFFKTDKDQNWSGLQVDCLLLGPPDLSDLIGPPDPSHLSWCGSFRSACGGVLAARKNPGNKPEEEKEQQGDFIMSIPLPPMPDGSSCMDGGFAEEPGTTHFALPANSMDPQVAQQQVLGVTPTTYSIIGPSRPDLFDSDDPFFYQDAARTFLVKQTQVPIQRVEWNQVDRVNLVATFHPAVYAASRALVQQKAFTLHLANG